jgi:dTDP-4-amino-4,6-dideoxygalactose transaminase
VPVHYAGVGCEMDAILSVAQHFGLSVVEDNAHGLFGTYKQRFLGTFGSLATQSFHETKNFTCGEGGALLINDPQLVERAEILREKGTNRSRFFRGQVDKYTWVDIGSATFLDILAAFLYAQFEHYLRSRRRRIWDLPYRIGWLGTCQPGAPNLHFCPLYIRSICIICCYLHLIRQRLINHLKARY